MIREQDCPAGCHFVPAGRLKHGSRSRVSSALDADWVRAEQCCTTNCAVNGDYAVPAHPEIHHFNWFTPRTGVTWSVVNVSDGCPANAQADFELGRCTGVTPGSLADAYCMGTGLHGDRSWDHGMEGCYVSEHECQRASSSLRSSRTILAPAEGSHGVGCSFQPADAALRTELSALSLEQLRVRAEYAGVDTVAIPQSIAASMVNMTKQAVIDLLLEELGSGCAVPKCHTPAGTITQIRSTKIAGFNSSLFPEGVWTKLSAADGMDYDEAGSLWAFNTAECGHMGCATFAFTDLGFESLQTDHTTVPFPFVDPALSEEFACFSEDRAARFTREHCPALFRGCLAAAECREAFREAVFDPNFGPGMLATAEPVVVPILQCVIAARLQPHESEGGDEPNDECIWECGSTCQERLWGDGGIHGGDPADSSELCECYLQCQRTQCSEESVDYILDPTNGLALNCLLHEVDEPCASDDGCFSGSCEEFVPCDATTRAGCLAQSYAADEDGFAENWNNRGECLAQQIEQGTAWQPRRDAMAAENACGACMWEETLSHSDCADQRGDTCDATDGFACAAAAGTDEATCTSAGECTWTACAPGDACVDCTATFSQECAAANGMGAQECFARGACTFTAAADRAAGSCQVSQEFGINVCADGTGLDTRPNVCVATGCFDGCLMSYSLGGGRPAEGNCNMNMTSADCATIPEWIWCGLDTSAPRCEFGTQTTGLSCERNVQLYGNPDHGETPFAIEIEGGKFAVPGICAARDNRPPLAAVALPHGYYPSNSGTHSFMSNSFGLFMNDLYQGGLRQRTVDGVVHSYYDSSSECAAACTSPEGDVLCHNNLCNSSQIRVFVPDRGSDTLSTYAWRVHSDDFVNTTRRDMILEEFLRTIIEGGVSSQDDITQHIIPGEGDFFYPGHFGPAYSVDLPDGTAVLKAVVDVQHPHGASSSYGTEQAELRGEVAFPSRSPGQSGQWCGAHSDCESGVCSDPCSSGMHWGMLSLQASGATSSQPCVTVSAQDNLLEILSGEYPPPSHGVCQPFNQTEWTP